MSINPIAVFCMIGLCCSCNYTGNNKRQPPTPSSKFLDSVLAKADISLSFIKNHTLIREYFTEKSKFTGDTVYFRDSDHPVVIMEYSDGMVCSKKFLLVYQRNTLKNTACKLVETDCDEDDASNYNRISFGIFNHTYFYTRDVWYIRDEGAKTKVTVDDQFYHFGKNGKIVLLSHKPPGITVPIFVPDDDNGSIEKDQ